MEPFGPLLIVPLVAAVVYLIAAPWGNQDAGPLYSAAQTPPTRDGNGNVDAGEVLKLALPSLKVLP